MFRAHVRACVHAYVCIHFNTRYLTFWPHGTLRTVLEVFRRQSRIISQSSTPSSKIGYRRQYALWLSVNCVHATLTREQLLCSLGFLIAIPPAFVGGMGPFRDLFARSSWGCWWSKPSALFFLPTHSVKYRNKQRTASNRPDVYFAYSWIVMLFYLTNLQKYPRCIKT